MSDNDPIETSFVPCLPSRGRHTPMQVALTTGRWIKAGAVLTLWVSIGLAIAAGATVFLACLFWGVRVVLHTLYGG